MSDQPFAGWGGDYCRLAGITGIAVPMIESDLRAWRAAADAIADALLEIYRRQRPERRRWWHRLYGDAPPDRLPDVESRDAFVRLLMPESFGAPDGQTLRATLNVSWADETLEVRIRAGDVSVTPTSEVMPARYAGARIDSPAFGTLTWHELDDVWCGRYHSDLLRGYADASEMRHRFRNPDAAIAMALRWLPKWSTFTGDFPLLVRTEPDEEPSEAQATLYQAFARDRESNERRLLSALFDWYLENRAGWVAEMRGSPDSINATLPAIDSPEGLLEVIQLSSVTVHPEPDDGRPAWIGFQFGWHNEHGIGIRWRNGAVEAIGDYDTAEYDE